MDGMNAFWGGRLMVSGCNKYLRNGWLHLDAV